MSANTSIEWTGRSWNPIAGCSLISPGCHRCYAMCMARRLKGVALRRLAAGQEPGRFRPYVDVIGNDGRWNGNLRLVSEALEEPKRWRQPTFVFTNSMSDLFHEHLSIGDIRQVCKAMAENSQHTFQVLTKRAGRLAELLNGVLHNFATLSHIWWGVSVENRRHGLPRIEHLRQVPAGGVRFLSVEPLLEDLGELNLEGIGWVIVGAESGAGARPMSEDWVRSLRDQCQRQAVPFFYKQKLEKGHKVSLPTLDGQVWNQIPDRVACEVAPLGKRDAMASCLAKASGLAPER